MVTPAETFNVPDTIEQREQWYRFWCMAKEFDTPQRIPKKGTLLTDPVIRAALDRAIADGKAKILRENQRSIFLVAEGA